ncbi:MAG: glycosyltransferase [Rubrivivax sp.]|nr:glycosyltransferase [Rubrivivax sp.]
MNILFVHQNFPGQFRHLAPALAQAGHAVHALSINRRPVPPGVTLHVYKAQRPPGFKPHPLAADVEAKVIRGEAAAGAMLALQREGFTPDLVIANPGWGEALFVKDVWPRARLVCLLEYFYRLEGGDVGFDPEFPPTGPLPGLRLRMKNLALLEAMNSMDLGVVPTRWQRSCLPAAFQSRLVEIFDGIDTDTVRPDPSARLVLPDGTALQAGDAVVTFVARSLEPLRGYHVFMRALPRLLQLCPTAQVLIVGADGVSYGAAAPAGQTWKSIFLDEVRDRIDERRVHFLGQLPYGQFLKVLQVSAAHVYLTYPFVLSWSCLEAMSAGCHLVGSATAPVQEFVADGVNGTLVDFFDTEALAAAVAAAVHERGSDGALRAAARQTVVERCDLRRLALPRYRQVLAELMSVPV